MATLLYDHLIDWNRLIQTLDSLEVHGEDRMELIEVIEETLHTEILIVFLDHLPTHVHDEFMHRLYASPHDPIHFEFIRQYGVLDIEEKVRQHSQKVIDELLIELLA